MPITIRTPVAVFLFNRPDHTAALLGALRGARPRRLLLVADGPRRDVAGEAERCAAARAVFDEIDWDCDITTNLAAANLGLKARFETGLTWVFEQVEQAIILEDDCLPGADFFPFCETLLERYADAAEIFSISGSQHLPGGGPGQASYYFSRYPMIWGWATWRRAWQRHDPEMQAWPAAQAEGWLERVLESQAAVQYWNYIFTTTYQRRHTWDYGWVFSCWQHGALSIHPRVNLVRNTGFGTQATHTHDRRSPLADLTVKALDWPLRHPDAIARDALADEALEQLEYGGQLARLMARARQQIHRPADAAGSG